jgi:hypothetical protein
MTREELQHIIRAAAEICEEPEFIVIGSQAIHGSLVDVNDFELIRSMEADLYPRHAPEKAELLNEIGLLSLFHNTHGIYADPVDETTATLPRGWFDRVQLLSGPLTETIGGYRARGLCLELHDLAVSKLAAGREKDVQFFNALVRRGNLQSETLRLRLSETELPSVKRRLVVALIDAAFRET